MGRRLPRIQKLDQNPEVSRSKSGVQVMADVARVARGRREARLMSADKNPGD